LLDQYTLGFLRSSGMPMLHQIQFFGGAIQALFQRLYLNPWRTTPFPIDPQPMRRLTP
jgi:hypothetical protein